MVDLGTIRDAKRCSVLRPFAALTLASLALVALAACTERSSHRPYAYPAPPPQGMPPQSGLAAGYSPAPPPRASTPAPSNGSSCATPTSATWGSAPANTGGCQRDTDCKSGTMCQSGSCVPTVGRCNFDSDCGGAKCSSQRCANSTYGTCNFDSDCGKGSGLRCSSHRCVR